MTEPAPPTAEEPTTFHPSPMHTTLTAHTLGRAALMWLHQSVCDRAHGLDHAADMAASRATGFAQAYTMSCVAMDATPIMETAVESAIDTASRSEDPYIVLGLMFPGLPIPTTPERTLP